jgi:hypothetical protein
MQKIELNYLKLVIVNKWKEVVDDQAISWRHINLIN